MSDPNLENAMGEQIHAMNVSILDLEREVERLHLALQTIRGTAFPAADAGRFAWAIQTFAIADSALNNEPQEQGSCAACGTWDAHRCPQDGYVRYLKDRVDFAREVFAKLPPDVLREAMTAVATDGGQPARHHDREAGEPHEPHEPHEQRESRPARSMGAGVVPAQPYRGRAAGHRGLSDRDLHG